MTAGKRLKEAREYLGLVQKDIADKIGYEWHKIKNIETEKHKLTPDIAEILEQNYSISGWWLLTGKGKMLINNEDTIVTSSNNHGYEIDVLNVKAAAGDGVYNYEIEVIDKIVLDKAFFRTAPDIKKIKIIEVDGDSMYPTLQSGDHVIIDETKTNGVDGIYAIQLHGQILIKRLQFNLNGTIDIKSDNKEYDTKSYNPNDTQIPLQVLGMKTLTIQR